MQEEVSASMDQLMDSVKQHISRSELKMEGVSNQLKKLEDKTDKFIELCNYLN